MYSCSKLCEIIFLVKWMSMSLFPPIKKIKNGKVVYTNTMYKTPILKIKIKKIGRQILTSLQVRGINISQLSIKAFDGGFWLHGELKAVLSLLCPKPPTSLLILWRRGRTGSTTQKEETLNTRRGRKEDIGKNMHKINWDGLLEGFG